MQTQQTLQDTRVCDRNLKKITLMVWLSRSFLYVPIFVVYLQDNGLTLQDVMLIKMIMATINLLLEIPSGYLADKYGRKNSLLAGGSLISLSLFLYGLGSSWPEFLIAEIILAVGWCLISGADSALVYDSLISAGQTEKYLRVESRLTSSAGYAEALGGVLVSLLVLSSLSAPFFVQALLMFLYALLAASLFEVKPQGGQKQRASWVELWKAVRYTLIEHRLLRWLSVYGALLSSAGFVLVWLAQPYMNTTGLPLEYFGLVWVAFHLVLGASSQLAYKVQKFFGRERTLLLCGLLMVAAYLFTALSNSLLGLCFICCSYVSRGLRNPVMQACLNEHIDSELRATMLSISKFAMGLAFIVMAPIFGWLVDSLEIQRAFIVIAVMLLALVSFCFSRLLQALENQQLLTTASEMP